jgi:hypothetical protein
VFSDTDLSTSEAYQLSIVITSSVQIRNLLLKKRSTVAFTMSPMSFPPPGSLTMHRQTGRAMPDDSSIALHYQLTRYKALLKRHFAGGCICSSCDSHWSSGPTPNTIHALTESDQMFMVLSSVLFQAALLRETARTILALGPELARPETDGEDA